jgi:hypothetical protein
VIDGPEIFNSFDGSIDMHSELALSLFSSIQFMQMPALLQLIFICHCIGRCDLHSKSFGALKNDMVRGGYIRFKS